ncbi:MAG: hypothetical protein ACKVQT_38775 [Burkholderiales bacterium]
MDIDRFHECAQAYGALRRRWPESAHALFDRFATSEEGQAILAEAERVDHFLDAWQADRSEAPTALEQAIIARANGMHPNRQIRARHAWWSTAAIILLGFALGFSQARREPAPDPIAQMIFGPTVQRGVGL